MNNTIATLVKATTLGNATTFGNATILGNSLTIAKAFFSNSEKKLFSNSSLVSALVNPDSLDDFNSEYPNGINSVSPFDAALTSKNIFSLKSVKPILIVFKLEDLSNGKFVKVRALSILDKNTLYTVSVKIRFSNSFFMAGNQFGFKILNIEDLEDLEVIVKERVNKSLDVYSLLDEDILYIQLSFKKVDSQIISEFSLKNSQIVASSIKDNQEKVVSINTANIPISVNHNTIGKPLTLDFDHGGFITKI